MGAVKVPADRYWGAQTQRSLGQVADEVISARAGRGAGRAVNRVGLLGVLWLDALWFVREIGCVADGRKRLHGGARADDGCRGGGPGCGNGVCFRPVSGR